MYPPYLLHTIWLPNPVNPFICWDMSKSRVNPVKWNRGFVKKLSCYSSENQKTHTLLLTWSTSYKNSFMHSLKNQTISLISAVPGSSCNLGLFTTGWLFAQTSLDLFPVGPQGGGQFSAMST